MKNRFHVGLILVAAVLANGCSKEIHVEAIPAGFDINGLTPTTIPAGRTGVFSQGFQNNIGTIEFQRTDSTSVQVMRTCTAGNSFCESFQMEDAANFVLKLSDTASVYSRHFLGNLWVTRASGDENKLNLNTEVLDSSGNRVKLVEESYQVTADPCGYGEGQGLEARQLITEGSGGTEWTTDSCQAYF